MVKKFDVVIGNPPYQEESTGDATHSMPVYHQFMDAAYDIGSKAILITPARFLFNAGYTPKAWNEKMLSDPHLSVPYYVPDSDALFAGTNINGGIAVTYRDEDRVGEPIDTFTNFVELNAIVQKVLHTGTGSMGSVITSSRSYRYTQAMHEAHPEAASTMSAGEQFKINTKTFDQLSYIFHASRPSDANEYIRVFGLKGKNRTSRWTRREYVSGPPNFSKYKVVAPASRGHLGTLGLSPALMVGSPFLAGPYDAVTQTYITIGGFDDEAAGEACLKYVKSRFARALLGVLKVTQHNPAKVWKYVPLQDFGSTSDIDWSQSVDEIDQQLYAKYGLDVDEIAFIESHVKPME